MGKRRIVWPSVPHTHCGHRCRIITVAIGDVSFCSKVELRHFESGWTTTGEGAREEPYRMENFSGHAEEDEAEGWG